MLQSYYRLLLICLFGSIIGCGGGGDSGENNTSTITGELSSAASMLFDSDINDKNTRFVNNSSFESAQSINNLVTVQGFVTATPTAYFSVNPEPSERSQDRFYLSSDENDFFQVQLNAGQVIQLQVANATNQISENIAFYGDIDIALYDDELNLVAISELASEFEHITVPETGSYYIHVYAYSGASKYALQLQPNDLEACGTETSSISMNFMPNELIVEYKEGVFPQTAKSHYRKLHAGHERPTLVFIDSPLRIQSSSATPLFEQELLKRNPKSAAKRNTLLALKRLRQQADVKHASLNYIRHAQLTPNDTHYHYQWHYPAIKLPQAWDITTGSPESGDVVVAVIDTGIFSTHPDLRNKLVPGFDFISSNANSGDSESGIDSNPEDPGDGQEAGSSSWHGTHVAGTIAAETNNSSGVAGVSWGAKIMPIRALGKTGGTSYDLMQAVRFAAGMSNDSGTLPTQAADIINLSLGGPGESQAERSLYQEVFDRGIMIVAAAGNENSSAPSYPASYPGVLSVSATTFNKTKAPYSNTGIHIDIAAPGGDLSLNSNGDDQPDGVLSTLVDDTGDSKRAIFSFYQGTSMATPHVSGVLALMKAIYPSLTAEMVNNLIANNLLSDDLGASGRDNIFGYGQINALKAVQQAQLLKNGGTPPPSPAVMLANPSSLHFTDGLPANLSISNEGDTQASITSIQTNTSWISVAELDTDADGLGTYLVTPDTSSLSNGVYLGSVDFKFDNAPDLCVRTSINIGAIDSTGSFPTTYVLLYDINKDEVRSGAPVTIYNKEYTFEDVPKGTYLLIAGSDIDNDGYICQTGESCAVYPANGQLQAIDTSEADFFDIDLTTSIINSLNGINTLSSHPENIKKRFRIPEYARQTKQVDSKQVAQ